MIKFTRCPKCRTLYELEGVDIAESGGWVQCGECDRKFKATSHAVEPDELSFTVSNLAFDDSMKIEGAVEEEDVEASMQIIDNVKKQDAEIPLSEEDELVDEKFIESDQLVDIETDTADIDTELVDIDSELVDIDTELEDSSIQDMLKESSQDIEQQQLIQQTQASESEFLEKTIILSEVEVTDGAGFDNILDNFSDDIFSPELIDEDDHEEKRSKNRVKNAYAKLHSEFSEEEISIQSSFSEKSLLEEEIEKSKASTITETVSEIDDGFKTIDIDAPSILSKAIPMLASFIFLLGLIGLFALQIHGRGTYRWIPQSSYEGLLSHFPVLAKFEKTQTDLSAIHLASTRMEVNSENATAHVISLQLVNRSFSNQAYPDFQLEFTDAKGDIIARRVIYPSIYLDQDHYGFLESRQAKTVFLNLEFLPDGAVGYQIKVIQQSS